MMNDMGDMTGMIAFAEKTLEEESDPETQAAMYYKLYGATAETRPNDAYMYAVKLRDSDLEVAWIYNYIAYDYAEKAKRLGLATTLADRAVEFAESAQDSASHLDTRGWVYFQGKNYEKALTDLEEAVRIAPEPSDEILGHLAQAQLKTGRVDEAFDTFTKVLVMGEYREARESIAEIMKQKGYNRRQRVAYENKLWEERFARAEQVEPFAMPAMDGSTYEFKPAASTVTVINFFSPT
jgi:lipopolysaccharide biosynthesis regulator YciM